MLTDWDTMSRTFYKIMKRNVILGALLISLSALFDYSQSAEEKVSKVVVDLSAYAHEYGNSAGNDLANEVVSRLSNRKVKYDPVKTRKLCQKAVSDLFIEEVLIPLEPFKKEEDMMADAGSPITRKFKLNLPGGIEWNEDVVIHFKADPKSRWNADTDFPDLLLVWAEFKLSDAIRGNGKIIVSGAASLVAEQAGAANPYPR